MLDNTCLLVCSACASAYNGEMSATASTTCQRGCQHELPAVENRLQQVSSSLQLVEYFHL